MQERLQVLEKQPIQTDIKIVNGIFVKICTFEAGSYIPQHSHSYEHLSICSSGSVKVWKEGIPVLNPSTGGDVFYAPAGISIPAHAKHLFQALEPNTTVLCVHRVEEGEEPDIHEEHQIVEA